MTPLRNVLPDLALLYDMIREGYIRKQYHPSEPLMILNYTDKATYDRKWNAATSMCRGLIISTGTGAHVVARPFPKFFNWNEPDAPEIGLEEQVYVTDKVDGSLGIRYWQPEAKRWAIATRGSFTSEQAVHGTELLHGYLDGEHRYQDNLDGVTKLYEIVYPQNRIVLDYGDVDQLVALGGVYIRTGRVLPASLVRQPAFGVSRAAVQHAAHTFGDALNLKPRPNAEGIVVITLGTPQKMVKVKQEDYVRLHRLMYGLNARVVWERMQEETLAQMKAQLPEEFWPWLERVYTEIAHKHWEILAEAKNRHYGILSILPEGFSRAEYAAKASEYPGWEKYLFLLLDGKSLRTVAWKQLRPSADDRPAAARNEDTA